MKIIGGLYKNQSLRTPKGLSTRPSKGKVREAVFNFLYPEVENSHFLDAFAGSGAMGLEALSRGADCVTFVDYESKAYESILINLKNLKVSSSRYCLMKRDSFKALKSFAPKSFDFIYLDPPFTEASLSNNLYQKALKIITLNELLKKDGRVICEIKKGACELLAEDYPGYSWKKERVYGDVSVKELRQEAF